MENALRNNLVKTSRIKVRNILAAAYFNTKISYLSKHVNSQFDNLYKDILFQRCNLEIQKLKNALSKLKSNPEAFA